MSERGRSVAHHAPDPSRTKHCPPSCSPAMTNARSVREIEEDMALSMSRKSVGSGKYLSAHMASALSCGVHHELVTGLATLGRMCHQTIEERSPIKQGVEGVG